MPVRSVMLSGMTDDEPDTRVIPPSRESPDEGPLPPPAGVPPVYEPSLPPGSVWPAGIPVPTNPTIAPPDYDDEPRPAS